MMLTPDYFTINQSEDIHELITQAATLSFIVFKNLSLKAIREFGFFKH